MKSIKELKNPDIITINEERYQVIDNTSAQYHTDKKELEMGIGLIKIGEKSLTPTCGLHYIYENPENTKLWKFFKNNPKTQEAEEVRIVSYKF